MKNALNKVGAWLSVAPVLLLPSAVFAQSTTVQTGLTGATGNLSGVGGALDAGTTDLPTLIGGLINVFLGLLGIIFLVMVVFAGYQYMMAGGDDEKTKKAKKLIANAVIGIIIVVAAYAISSYVIGAITTAATTV